MADSNQGNVDTTRVRKMTEAGKAYQLSLKQDVYKKCERSLIKVGNEIVKALEETETSGTRPDEALRTAYISWKRNYVMFVQTEADLRALLDEDAKEPHTEEHRQVLCKFNEMKLKMENKLEPTDPTHKAAVAPSASGRSSGSVRSRIGLLRLEEGQRRAELMAKEAATKQRLAIERQQQELKWKMEQLQVEEEKSILEAKSAALLKFEEGEGMCAQESTQLLPATRLITSTGETAQLPSAGHFNACTDETAQLLSAGRFNTCTDETTQLLSTTRFNASTDATAQLPPATHLNVSSDAARDVTASMPMLPPYPVPQAGAVAGPGDISNQQPARDQLNQSSSAVDVLSTLAKLLTEKNNENRLPVLEPELFTGNIEKFPVWIKGFETYVEHRTSCPIERLHFLGRYTDGAAHSAIAGFLHLRTSDAYTKAKEKLVSRYGNDYLLANSYSKRLRDWPVIRGGDNKGLQQLADFLEHCLMASSAIAGMRTLDDPYTVQLVLKKLPYYVSDRWKRVVDSSVFGRSPRYPTFAAFVDFITTEARIACGPVSMQMEGEADTRGARPRGKVHTFSSSAEVCNACGHQSNPAREKSVTRSRQCVICGADHSVTACSKFIKMTLTDRRHAVEERRLCRGCLRPGHMWRDCRRKERCSVCQRLHPSLLHDDVIQIKTKEDTRKTSQARESQQRASPETSAKATTLRSSLGDMQEHNSSHCHTMIVPVKVFHRHRPERALITYALLDAQSDASFMTDSVCKTLQVSGSEVELELSTMAGTTSFSSQLVKDLRIESLADGSVTDLPDMYTRAHIPADRSLIPQPKTCEKWPHLRQLADDIHDEFADAEIGLLLGINCARAIKPREIIPGDNDDPWAVRTMLGWGIVGLVANRVQEIRQSTNPEQWLYIESKMNPADLASRGATVAELIESSLWWHGPPFLTAQQNLPVTKEQFGVADEDPEVKRSTFQTVTSQKQEKKKKMTKEKMSKEKTMMKEVNELCASSEGDENLTPVTPQDESHKVTGERSKDKQDAAEAPMSDLPRRMTYFSNWHRAKKSVALCVRYKHVLAAKVNAGRCTTAKVYSQDLRVGKPLTVEELHRGETEILKATQKEAFQDEYALLSTAKNEKKFSKKSRLFRLDPYLDKDGVIRVGGRISRSAMSPEVSHPAILPRHSHVTELLVKHYHEKTGHSGRGSTLNELRAAGYWIVGGRSAVSSHILSCVTCKRLRGNRQQPPTNIRVKLSRRNAYAPQPQSVTNSQRSSSNPLSRVLHPRRLVRPTTLAAGPVPGEPVLDEVEEGDLNDSGDARAPEMAAPAA
ncbi:uncharacterized protein LOC122376051 [Amphibalanus amphitrite]|uniref:uncharacterized protein LOC122376051 n=1 Tax=Amphibalanus amphitrite TaxID=1232801 RepID=UPI001C91B8F1|nr:uncharacterized protein LOC122376051 [Amphibalanus amphitrite]